MELLVARNPDPDSSLPYLLRLPLGGGLVYRTRGTWPRTAALYCHPVPPEEWPAEPDLVDRVPLVSCVRRGAAIDVVADRGREQRSQLVHTTARGRDVVFWQSPRTRRQARPAVRTPTARASGAVDLEIVVDTRERYPYTFPNQQVKTVRRALPCGDYAVLAHGRDDGAGSAIGGQVVAVVERKSLADLLTSLTTGTLRYALGELAAVPRAAVVVEDRYSQVFAQDRLRPSQVADDLARLQVRWPAVPLVFAETRKLAEEWTYRYLAAAAVWAGEEAAVGTRLHPAPPGADAAGRDWPGLASELDVAVPAMAEPTTAEVRAWARARGMPVSDRGRLRPEIHRAWREAHR